MANIDVWIQLENRPWDTMPNNIDRMTGKTAQQITAKAPEMVTIVSPGTGVTKTRQMFAPLRGPDGKVIDALIFRRYKSPTKPDKSDAWTIPDDRKVNPWDLNEPDPTDNGTMGTIPGPVIECSLNTSDQMTVHFRNLDLRAGKSEKSRSHSMHVHGFVFEVTSDGAYPLTPADPGQPVPPEERTFWNGIGVTGPNKMGDRVPPRGTFTYTWKTIGWGSTAGVWLYHDHSFCDMDNISLGAIGSVVIHNSNDVNDITVGPGDLPAGNVNGNVVDVTCRHFPFPDFPPVVVTRGLIEKAGQLDAFMHRLIPHTHPGDAAVPEHDDLPDPSTDKTIIKPVLKQMIQQNDLLMHLNADFTQVIGFCTRNFKTPPDKAQYIQLYHNLNGSPGMCVNGRTFLGNTPTVIAGTNTKMRFGVIGMGSEPHTFHIHGHRWILPGPDGNTPGAIQGSAQNKPVSQFEDTRLFSHANSFVFTIDGASGSFMRAGGPSPGLAKGEWHMHCHVLSHMMSGMMGSLLIVDGGDLFTTLPKGEECDDTVVVPQQLPTDHLVNITNFQFSTPTNMPVKMGDTVRFVNNDNDLHSIFWDSPSSPANSPNMAHAVTYDAVMNSMGTFNYHCGIHGVSMSGTVNVTM